MAQQAPSLTPDSYMMSKSAPANAPGLPKQKDPVLNAPEESGLLTGPLQTGVPGAEQAVTRTATSMADAPRQILNAVGHAFDAPSLDEKEAYKGKVELSPYARPILAVERMVGQPVAVAKKFYAPAFGGGTPQDKENLQNADLTSVMPEALGSATAQYFGGKAAGELIDNALPKGGPAEATPARTTMLSRAVRPGGKAAQKFPDNVQHAYPAIQEEIARNQGELPTTLGDFNDLLGAARKRVWGQVQDLLTKAQNTRPQVKGLLQSPEASVQTGVQQVTGEAPGALIPAESRPVVQNGPPAQFVQAARSDAPGATIGGRAPGIGSTNATVPQRILGTQPEIGSQYAAVPDSVMGPKTVQGEQFLSGSAHPEMSGQLTNPGVLLTRDTAALQATRTRLASVINDPETFSKLGPAEQEAYTAQLSRLNKLLQPGPNVPHGPAIDGNAVASAIEASVRPRPKLFDSSSVAELQSRANAYRGRRISLSDAEELLQDANREASSWYHSPDPHGPQYQASAAAEASEIRNQLYKQIDALSESDPGTYGQLKKTYGGLEALQGFTQKRIPVVSRQAPINLLEGGGIMAGLDLLSHAHDLKSAAAAPLPWLAAKGARYINSPEFLLKQSLKQPSNVPAPIRAAAVGAARVAPLAPRKKE